MNRRSVLLIFAFCYGPMALAQPLACTPGELLIELLDGPERLTQRQLSETPAAWDPQQSTLLLTWRGGGQNLQGQRFSIDLSPFDGQPTELVSSSAIQPAVAFNVATRRYALVWQTQAGSVGDFNSLIGQVFDDSLDPVAPAAQVSPGFGGAEPWLIATGSTFETSARSPVAVYRINADGSLGSSSPALPAASAAAAPNGAVAFNPQDLQYLATWRNQTDARLEGAILNSALSPVGSSFVISPTYPGSGRAGYSFWDEGGQRYLVLFDSFDDSSVRLRQVTSAGNPGSDDLVLVPDQPANSPGRARVSWLADAGVMALVRTETVPGESARALLRLFDAEGQALAEPLALPVSDSERVESVARPLVLTGRSEMVFFANLFDEDSLHSSTALWRYRIAFCPLLFSDRFESDPP